MADSNVEYLKLITSEYAKQKKFNQYVETFLDHISPTVDNLNEFDILFNLETAVGDQLDIIGSILNVSRTLPVDNVNIPSVLGDELYRKVLRSTVYKNHWDGTISGLQDIFKYIFPSVDVDIQDNQDMSYDIFINDVTFSGTDLELLKLGYILPKPSGVRVNYEIFDRVLFGFDSDADYIKGWDDGIWKDN